MTLIVTVATKANMVQVSDRRLTRPDGTLFDSLAHKLVPVTCRDARFSIAYTGLAHTGVLYADKAENRDYQRPVGYSQSPYERTDEWLVDILGTMDIGRMGFGAIRDFLVEQAGRTFSMVPYDKKYRGLTFVVCGYWNGDQFIVIISNMEDAKGNRVGISDAFQTWTYDISRKKSADMLFYGVKTAVHDTVGRRLEKIKHRVYDLTGPEVVKEVERLIRATTRHPSLGKYIGRDYSHAIIAPQPGIATGDHQEVASKVHTMPPFLLGGMAFKGVSMRPVHDDEDDRMHQP